MGNFYWTNFDYIWNDLDLVLRDWHRMVVEPKKQLASLPNYPHSDCWVDDDCNKLSLRFALAGYEKSWTFEELNGYLIKPAKWIKGTKMAFAGLRKEKDRASVILYLNQNSDNPLPLP